MYRCKKWWNCVSLFVVSQSQLPNEGRTPPGKHLVKHQRVDRYEVVEQLASGGMGEVYLAKDPDLDRFVVLKFISTALCADEHCRARFLREAKAIAKLNHPNIVQIHEVAEYKDRLYFAMEYVEGPSLQEVCDAAGDRTLRVLEIALQICDGLSVAHREGITHLDIKPANILVDSEYRVRLADFGLASVAGSDIAAHHESSPGTVGYMSPEQVRAEEIDYRSDIFSLGVVLYELLSGRRPFSGEYEAAIQYSVANDPVPPLRDKVPSVSEGLQHLVGRMLSKSASARLSSIDEVKSLLMLEKRAIETRAFGFTRARTFVWVLPLVALTLAGWYFGWYRSSGPAPPIRLAILPLENLGSPGDQYLTTGLTQAISTGLAGLDAIQVIAIRGEDISASSAEPSRQQVRPFQVDYLLKGTIALETPSDTGQTRITLQLVSGAGSEDVWHNEYQPSPHQLVVVQSQIAHDVVDALDISVSESQLEKLSRLPTESPQAWDLFLRGNEYFNRTWSAEDILIAIRMYDRALALDSSFALAWAMNSRGHSSLYWEFADRSEERCQLALNAAEKALALRPDLAEGHEAMGYCYYHCFKRLDAALDEFESGLLFQPSNADLYNAIAAVQRRQGKLTSAVENFKRALSLDPRSHLKAFDIALTYGMMRRYDSAHTYVDRTVALTSDWVLPHVYRAWLSIIENGDTAAARLCLAEAHNRLDLYQSPFYWWLSRLLESDYYQTLEVSRPGNDTTAYYIHRSRLYRLLGDHSAARACADSARQLLKPLLRHRSEEPQYLSHMSLALAYLGDCGEALKLGERAIEFLPAAREAFDGPFLLINMAEACVLCEQPDAAVRQLEIVLSVPGFVSVDYLKLDPLWISLRDNEEFNALINRKMFDAMPDE